MGDDLDDFPSLIQANLPKTVLRLEKNPYDLPTITDVKDEDRRTKQRWCTLRRCSHEHNGRDGDNSGGNRQPHSAGATFYTAISTIAATTGTTNRTRSAVTTAMDALQWCPGLLRRIRRRRLGNDDSRQLRGPLQRCHGLIRRLRRWR